jgi:TPR repeat protein
MSRRSFATWLIGAALAALPCAPALAQTDRHEDALRQELQQTLWPADFVRRSNEYLRRYPQAADAAQARSALDSAQRSVQLLQTNKVRLYRADFELRGAPPAAREEVRLAAFGDKEAALRLAHLYDSGDGGLARNSNRYVAWLQYAAALGNGPASYELAVYYRRQDQPALAAPYEARAEELGFQAPVSLDHIRK